MKTSSYIIRLKSAAKKYFEELEAGEPNGYRARIIKDDKYFNDLVSNYEALTYNE